MTAARTGRAGPVNALLQRGADVTPRNVADKRLSCGAAADGHTAVVELLIKAARTSMRRCRIPDSPRCSSRRARTHRRRFALLKAGADVNETNASPKPTAKVRGREPAR